MKFLNDLNFWQTFWTVYLVMGIIVLVVMDVTAMLIGNKDKVGDEFTFTHWLVAHVGLSIIGAFIGYLIAHFLIVHHNG